MTQAISHLRMAISISCVDAFTRVLVMAHLHVLNGSSSLSQAISNAIVVSYGWEDMLHIQSMTNMELC